MKTLQISLITLLSLLLLSTIVWGQNAGDYQTHQSGAWNSSSTWERYNGSSWITPAGPPTDTSGAITIRSSDSVTVTASVSVDQVTLNGKLTIPRVAATLTIANGTGTDFIVASGGIFKNAAFSGGISVSGTWQVQSGGTYIHQTTTAISTPFDNLTLDSTSTFIYRGKAALNTGVTFSGRTYGNLTVESDSGNWQKSGITGTSTVTVKGNLSIGGTGAGTIKFDHSGASGQVIVFGAVTVVSSDTFITTTGAQTYYNNITNNGAITISGTNTSIFNGTTTLSGNNVTFTNGFTVNANKSLAISTNGNILAAAKTATINGTFQINEGAWTGSNGTFTYGASGTLVFNNTSGNYGPIDNSHLYWPSSSGPANVTIQGTGGINLTVARTVSGTFQTAAQANGAGNLTLNGTAQINAGGYFTGSPTYGGSSTLKYNTGTTYGRGTEWNATSGAGSPASVQMSNNTTLNYTAGANSNMSLSGNLTIDAGSALYMDYGSPGWNKSLTVAGNLLLNGNLSLGDGVGGDLNIGGNWTYSPGSFNANDRAVTLNGTGTQTITGATTFAYLTVNKASGVVNLSDNITMNKALTITAGTMNTGSKKVTLGSTGSLSEAGSGVIVLGTVEATRTLSGTGNETFGGIGLELNPANSPYPGATTVTRVTGTAKTGSGNQSIKRYYDVVAATSTGLDLTLVYHYDDAASEIGAQNENTFSLYRSATGSDPWTLVTPSSASTAANTLTKTGVTDLSTWTAADASNPMVTSASMNSDVVTANGESATISSLVNDASPLTSSTGVQTWQVNLRDGGGSADADALPTQLTAITFSQGAGNTVSNWSNAILAADLFDGSTRLASGTVGASSIAFTGLSGVEAADDGSKTLSLRISLKNPLGSGVADNQKFVFAVTSANVTAGAGATSSQFAGFTTTNSDNTKNTIAVVASKLVFTTQPSATGTNGVALSQQPVATAEDANGNTDIDYSGTVTLSNSGSFSMSGNAVAASSGVVTYTTLAINGTGSVTLSTTNGDGLTNATSNSITLSGAEPTTQATALNFTTVTATSLTLSWTNGDGSDRIVIARSGSAVSTGPSDGVTYTANTAFGSGTAIGSGFAIYSGTGNSVTVTGLTTGTTYHFAVYEFNGSGGAENYLTTSPATGNATPGVVQSLTSGNWSSSSTWIGGVVPTSTDNVLIASGHTVTVDDANAVSNSITFGAATSKISFATGSVLSVSGDFTLFSTTHNAIGTWATGAKLKFVGSAATQTLSGWNTGTTMSTSFMEMQVDKSSGKVTTTGNNMKLNIGTSLEIVNGTFEVALTDDINGRILDGGTSTPTITVQEGGIFSVVAGATQIQSGTTAGTPIGKMTVYGNVDLSTTSTNKINFGNVDVENGGVFTLNSGGTTGNFNPGVITIKSGGVFLNSGTTNVWAAGSTVTLQTGGVYKTTTSTTPFPPTFNNNGTVRYQRTASGDQTIADMNYHRLEISFSGNNKVWTLAASRTIEDSLEVNNSANLVLSASTAQTLNQDGTIRLTSGSLDNSDADVTLNLADGVTISRATGTITNAPTFGTTVNLRYTSTASDVSAGPEVPASSTTLNNLQIITDTRTVTLTNPLTVNGTLTLSNGNIDNSTQTLTMANGSYIRRATGALTTAPTFAGSVNVAYISSISSVTTGVELPASTTALDTLLIDSPMDVTLGQNATVNGALQFSDGRFYLGENSLTLGSNATVSGTPGTGEMVVTNGAGSLKKVFATTGSFTYPVGDTVGTAEYTPATLNFTSGSFDPGAEAGVRVVNARHPNDPSANDYLNRYWNVTQTGISGFSADATYQYADGDVQGNESNIVLGQWDSPNWTRYGAANTASNELTGTVTNFSDFSGIEAGAPAFGASPSPVTFNPTVVSSSSSDTVTVTNSGTDVLLIDSVRTYGGEFSVNPSGSTSVGISATKKYGVNFSPTGLGVQNGYVVFYSNASSSPDTVSLSGEGVSTTYTLTVNTSGNGSVQKNPNQSVFTEGESVVLTATPGVGYHFVGWSGDTTSSANPITVTMNSNKTITATFAINTYTLSVNAANGSVTKNPDQAQYDSNSTVELTALPSTGYHFVNWSGDASGSTNPLMVTMNSNKNITANFVIDTLMITASAGSNGAIAPSGSVQVLYGDDQRFTFTPEAEYSVDSVFVDGAYVDSTEGYTFENVTASHTINVTFVIASFTLDISTSGNGSVTKNPDQVSYDNGSSVELTAVPANGWTFDGWSGDATGTTNPLNVTMDANKSITATFSQDSAYLQSFRSLRPNDIYLDVDNAGKQGKSVKAKADKVEYSFTLKTDSNNVNDLHVELSLGIDTTLEYTVTPTPDSMAPVAKSGLKKWDYFFSTALDSGDSVVITGWSRKGSLQKVSKFWWTRDGAVIGKKLSKGAVFTKNVVRLPMPNRLNISEDVFKQGKITGDIPITVGVARTDSAKKYAWVLMKSAGDMYKSMGVVVKKVTYLHDSTPRGFDRIISGKSDKDMVGKFTSLPPNKQDNILFANLAALKLSIAASILEKTPNGFGEIVYDDTASNPYNGWMLKDIAAKADTMMTGYPGRQFEDSATYAVLNWTIARVLDAFEGPMDTLQFGGKLKTAGTHQLAEYSFLSWNSSVVPAKAVPLAEGTVIPEQFELQQNYPNPFNPATVIAFDLPEASTVTLKIYNILGQEVATILNHQQFDEGIQTVEFNATSFASGVYLYRITATSVDGDGVTSTFTSVKKMLLTK